MKEKKIRKTWCISKTIQIKIAWDNLFKTKASKIKCNLSYANRQLNLVWNVYENTQLKSFTLLFIASTTCFVSHSQQHKTQF